SIAALSGRGAPTGGIISARTFRITFSHTSAVFEGRTKSAASSDNPAVFIFWLWQVTQYLSTSARSCPKLRREDHRMRTHAKAKTSFRFMCLPNLTTRAFRGQAFVTNCLEVYCEGFLSTERKPNAVPPIDLLSGGEIQIGNGNLDGVSVIQNPKHVAYDGVVLDRHAM